MFRGKNNGKNLGGLARVCYRDISSLIRERKFLFTKESQHSRGQWEKMWDFKGRK